MQTKQTVRRLNRAETKAVAGGTAGSGFVKPAAVPVRPASDRIWTG